tara:strand:+ start:464 stop:1261 length:798 start_codon:yes stop_codon:yes gene_type:complete
MNDQKKPGYKRKRFFKKIKVSFYSFVSDWFGDISISNFFRKIKFFLFFGLTVYIIFFFIDDYQRKQNYKYEQQRLLESELRFKEIELNNIKLEKEQQRREEEQQRREQEQRSEQEQRRKEEQIQERNNFLKKIKKIPSSIIKNKIFIELDWNFDSRKLFTIKNNDWISSRFNVTNESNWKIERIELSYNYFSSFNNSFLKEEKIILENYHIISQFSFKKGKLNINNKRGLPLSTETYYVPSNYENSENQYIKWKIEGIYGYELSN